MSYLMGHSPFFLVKLVQSFRVWAWFSNNWSHHLLYVYWHFLTLMKSKAASLRVGLPGAATCDSAAGATGKAAALKRGAAVPPSHLGGSWEGSRELGSWWKDWRAWNWKYRKLLLRATEGFWMWLGMLMSSEMKVFGRADFNPHAAKKPSNGVLRCDGWMFQVRLRNEEAEEAKMS